MAIAVVSVSAIRRNHYHNPRRLFFMQVTSSLHTLRNFRRLISAMAEVMRYYHTTPWHHANIQHSLPP
jgi:hypothetical protein